MHGGPGDPIVFVDVEKGWIKKGGSVVGKHNDILSVSILLMAMNFCML